MPFYARKLQLVNDSMPFKKCHDSLEHAFQQWFMSIWIDKAVRLGSNKCNFAESGHILKMALGCFSLNCQLCAAKIATFPCLWNESSEQIWWYTSF